jgi:aminoglycoside phosphotransferase
MTTPDSVSPLLKEDIPSIAQVLSAKDVLGECGGRRVVRVTPDIVVKYGRKVHFKQAESTAFVVSHTSIPVPRILATLTDDGNNFIFMTRLPGVPLSECIDSLSQAELDANARELKGYFDQLRNLAIVDFEERQFIGSI